MLAKDTKTDFSEDELADRISSGCIRLTGFNPDTAELFEMYIHHDELRYWTKNDRGNTALFGYRHYPINEVKESPGLIAQLKQKAKYG